MDLDLWLSLGAIFVLLCLSGFFSGSETALTAASKGRMHSLEKQGNKRAGLVNKLREHKDKLIGALLLGNNLVNILASALATSVLIKLVGEAGVAIATLVMTFLVLIFAEVLPKTYALHFADSMALAIAPVIRVIVAILAPITSAIAKLVRWVLRLFGADIESLHIGGMDADLLRGVIELYHGSEPEDVQEERAMLRSILDLQDVEVEDIMIHRSNVMMLDASKSIVELLDQVMSNPYTRYPLYDGDPENIIGVVHAKLLLKEIRACGGNIEIVDIGSVALEPWFIPETTDLFDQLQEFRARKEHFALVVDEYGAFMGIVTLEDILEEIVGQIDDEHDVATQNVKPEVTGTYLVAGDTTIRDVNRDFGWDLPDEEYATVAGLVLFESQSIPEIGQVFQFFGARFEVVAKDGNRLTEIRVTPAGNEETEEVVSLG